MLPFAAVKAALSLAGVDTPAFAELFGQAVKLFKPGEQAELKDAYAKARQASDEAQDDFTQAGRGH